MPVDLVASILELTRAHDELARERESLVARLDAVTKQLEDVRAQIAARVRPAAGSAIGAVVLGDPDRLRGAPFMRLRGVGALGRRFVETLMANPVAAYPELCIALYDEDTPAARNRLRAVAHDLVGRGYVRVAGRGRWVVDQERMRAALGSEANTTLPNGSATLPSAAASRNGADDDSASRVAGAQPNAGTPADTHPHPNAPRQKRQLQQLSPGLRAAMHAILDEPDSVPGPDGAKRPTTRSGSSTRRKTTAQSRRKART